MTRAKQLSFFGEPRKNTKWWWIAKQHSYGGALERRKVARPFDSKKLTHAVLSARLGKALRFTKSTQSIQNLIRRGADRYNIKLRELAVNHDHIHLLFSTRRRENQIRFLRFIAAELGRKYHALAGRFGVRVKGSIWRHRPFTRLVGWQKRSLAAVANYIRKNRFEALGFIAYTPRGHRLNRFLEKWRESMSAAPG